MCAASARRTNLAKTRFPCSPVNCLRWSVQIPNLQSLGGSLSLLPGDTPLIFPSCLQRLRVMLALPHSAPAVPLPRYDELFAAIAQLQQLHTLRLRFTSREDVSFVALQQLPLLRDLHLHGWFPNVAQSATELRALCGLHRFHILARVGAPEAEDQRTAFIQALLRDAPDEPQLHWRNFAFRGVCLH